MSLATGAGLVPGSKEWVAAIKAHFSDPEVKQLCDLFTFQHSRVVYLTEEVKNYSEKIAQLESVFVHAFDLASKQARALKTISDMIQETKNYGDEQRQ